ncbi:MAG: S8 family serine peptidase [Phycisphaerales bacterium]|nr:S8 family serine peptidase [Phycisphaerales bacterium]
MNKNRIVRAVFAFAGLVVPLSPVCGADAGPTIHFMKDARPLAIDRSAIAVFGGADRSMSLASMGVAPERAREWPIAGWSLVEQIGAPDDAAIVAEVARLSGGRGLDFVTPVFIGEDGGPLFPTPDILAGFDPALTPAQVDAIVGALGAGTVVERDFGGMPGAVRIASGMRNGLDVLEAAASLARRPEALWAEPDMVFTGGGSLLPNDEFFSLCWGLHNTGQTGGLPGFDMDAAEAWDITLGDPSVIVLVIDTGVQQNHPDINQVAGADLTSDGPGTGGPVNSFDNHGTPVAGCVSGIINNSIGAVGVAPETRSASARTFIAVNASGNWTSTASWTVNALAFGESIGARVSNNSNYYGFSSSTIANKYAQTRDDGMVHFASAGNDALPTISYPSSLPSVNSVASVAHNGALSSFSNFGVGLAFSAPGTSIVSADRTGAAGYVNGSYVIISGTSFASPYTAGVAALVLSVNPSLTAPEVEAILQGACTDLGALGYDTVYGHGMVNAHRSVMDATVCVGDIDMDDFIGFTDLNIIVSSFNTALGEIGYNPAADLDGDHFIGFSDLNIVVSAFNTDCP